MKDAESGGARLVFVSDADIALALCTPVSMHGSWVIQPAVAPHPGHSGLSSGIHSTEAFWSDLLLPLQYTCWSAAVVGFQAPVRAAAACAHRCGVAQGILAQATLCRAGAGCEAAQLQPPSSCAGRPGTSGRCAAPIPASRVALQRPCAALTGQRIIFLLRCCVPSIAQDLVIMHQGEGGDQSILPVRISQHSTMQAAGCRQCRPAAQGRTSMCRFLPS